MPQTSAELRRCPFCGSNNVGVRHKQYRYSVRCQSCWVRGPLFGSVAEATAAWNISLGDIITRRCGGV